MTLKEATRLTRENKLAISNTRKEASYNKILEALRDDDTPDETIVFLLFHFPGAA